MKTSVPTRRNRLERKKISRLEIRIPLYLKEDMMSKLKSIHTGESEPNLSGLIRRLMEQWVSGDLDDRITLED